MCLHRISMVVCGESLVFCYRIWIRLPGSLRHSLAYTYIKTYIFFWRDSPQQAGASSFTRFIDHTTTTHHSRQNYSGRVISSSQRPLPDNTQHSKQTDIHTAGGIRTHNLKRRAATGTGHAHLYNYINTLCNYINTFCNYIQGKGKVKFTLVKALRLCTGRTAQRGSRGIALLFLDSGTRRG